MNVVSIHDFDTPDGARPAVTLGNFDGVHLGHQRAMTLLRERARALSSPSVAVTFEPHPISVLRPSEAPKRILTPEAKREVLASLGIDWLVVIDFTLQFSRVEPADFVENVLVEKLRVAELVLGGNFRFGRGRTGDVDSLRRMGDRFGFVVHRVDASMYRGEMISSSRIRRRLEAGDVEAAAAMLGRPYFVDGDVVEGDGRGRRMGFPTANVRVVGELLAGDGVYVTEALLGSERHRGMAHIGVRPTFGLDTRALETHLFGFDRNVYGERIRLYFHRRLRGTVRFDSAEALEEQLRRDRAEAEAYFEARDGGSNRDGNLVL